MLSTAADAASVHDPDAHGHTYSRRSDAELPFDPAAIPADVPVMPDTTVYIHRLQRRAPAAILDLLLKRTVLHAAVALSEISISVGTLDPRHPETARNRATLLGLMEAISLSDCRAPSAAAWVEAGALAGIIARTQLGLPRASAKVTAEQRQANKDRRRRLLNDALMFLTAREQEAVLVSGNVSDMDLMLRLNPGVRVLLYRPTALPG